MPDFSDPMFLVVTAAGLVFIVSLIGLARRFWKRARQSYPQVHVADIRHLRRRHGQARMNRTIVRRHVE